MPVLIPKQPTIDRSACKSDEIKRCTSTCHQAIPHLALSAPPGAISPAGVLQEICDDLAFGSPMGIDIARSSGSSAGRLEMEL